MTEYKLTDNDKGESIASKKSLYSIHSSLLLLTLTLGDFLPVTSFADAGIATNDTVLMQPKTDTDTNTSEDPQH